MTDTFTSPAPLQTAVLFLVFNRPDTTAQVFESIRKAKPPRLYVAADGPRFDREGEAEKVAKVREIATAVDWPCEVKTLFRSENLGCNYGPRAGIDWFFSNEEQGIILEDDCLPSQSFFWFCELMLNYFKTNERIMVVTGTNITKNEQKFDYWFSNYALIWGWASWRRAWNLYDPSLINWATKKNHKRWLRELKIGSCAFVSVWSRIFDKTVRLGPNVTWWDYQWIYSCWSQNGLTVAPRLNLIKNIGFSNQATHTKEQHPILSNLIEHELEFPLTHPKEIRVNIEADQYISRHWFNVNWLTSIIYLVLELPGMEQLNSYRKKILNNK